MMRCIIPLAQCQNDGGDPTLSQLVDENQEAMIGSIQELIKIKSAKGDPVHGKPFGTGPTEALDKALLIARGMGFNTTNLDGYMGYAEFGHGDEYVGVLAHLDVVPEGEGWTYPPYAAEIHDSKIYGRGAIDDKGPAMAALYAAKALKDSGLPLSKKVRVIFGTTEETGDEDVIYYLSHEKPPVLGFTPDGYYPVVYAEKGNTNFNLVMDLINRSPENRVISIQGGTAGNSVPDQAQAEVITSNPIALIQACRSFVNQTGYDLKAEEANEKVMIRSKGLAAHGSEPEKGKNAIMRLLSFLDTLDLGSSDLGMAIHFINSKVGEETDGRSFGIAMSDNVSGNLSFNVGMIDATEDRITLALNLRYPVTYKFEGMMNPFNQTISGTGFRVELMRDQKPLYYPRNSSLVNTLLKVYSEMTGDKSEPLAIGGGTYAKQMPNTVAFGPIFPGRPMVEHQPNEYIPLQDLVLNAKIYAQAIYELAK